MLGREESIAKEWFEYGYPVGRRGSCQHLLPTEVLTIRRHCHGQLRFAVE